MMDDSGLNGETWSDISPQEEVKLLLPSGWKRVKDQADHYV
jgi:hypothetical protein